ncbi:hypothetical protein [Brevibacterium epidermidis]|uniref:hypothetical protein n=1 Tax=Brevibacterium epidermidis TaxID=1698 RepID=UPI000BF83056|nr:hypothetical protein [Brevibacterium epidermidis]
MKTTDYPLEAHLADLRREANRELKTPDDHQYLAEVRAETIAVLARHLAELVNPDGDRLPADILTATAEAVEVISALAEIGVDMATAETTDDYGRLEWHEARLVARGRLRGGLSNAEEERLLDTRARLMEMTVEAEEDDG